MFGAARHYLLYRRLRMPYLLVLILIGLAPACQPATRTLRAPAPTVPIRHRDALPLMLTAEDLGFGAVEKQRLERGLGWGEDTTRLSGYRVAFAGDGQVFSRISSQVECYITAADAQEAYRAYYSSLAKRLKGDASYTAVQEMEEQLVGEWSRVLSAHSSSGLELHYVFMRENVLVALVFAGPDSPELEQQAIRQARVVDERIYGR